MWDKSYWETTEILDEGMVSKVEANMRLKASGDGPSHKW